MLQMMFKHLVFLFPIFLHTQAFWWGTTTTEAPPPSTVMKQIPLTYFRTYTYQQPIGNHQLQLPLLSSTDYIANQQALGTTPYFNPMMPIMPMAPFPLAASNEIPLDVRPAKNYASVSLVRSLNNIVPAPSGATTVTTQEPTTTSTTTTTTTPVPITTTTTTTTTTEASTTLADEETPLTVLPLMKSDAMGNIEGVYPALNRKAFTNHFNINYNRPIYPSPEYTTYNTRAEDNLAVAPNIEFIPCMCPVNIAQVGYAGYAPGQPLNSMFLGQSHTETEAEGSSSNTPLQQIAVNADFKAQAEVTNLVEDLQTGQLEEDENDKSPNV